MTAFLQLISCRILLIDKKQNGNVAANKLLMVDSVGCLLSRKRLSRKKVTVTVSKEIVEWVND